MKLVEATVRRATDEDVTVLSTVVADALMAQPVSAWLVPDLADGDHHHGLPLRPGRRPAVARHRRPRP